MLESLLKLLIRLVLSLVFGFFTFIYICTFLIVAGFLT